MLPFPLSYLAAVLGALVALLALVRIFGGRRARPRVPRIPRTTERPLVRFAEAKATAGAAGAARAAPEPAEEEVPLKSDIRALTGPGLPRIDYEEDAEADPTLIGAVRPTTELSTTKIVYDTDAEPEEPTQASALILVSATGQTNAGRRRKRNEDSLLVLEDQNLFVVADGMGGYTGGAIASKLAVETIAQTFRDATFEEKKDSGGIPKRARELATAVQRANAEIYREAKKDRALSGMGTTVCAARFSPNKQRLYLAHVGDSRVYRMRAGVLRQMTADHTMKDLGVGGASSTHLSRAVGVWPQVSIDVVLGKPQPGDTYLLCSDGLSKMVSDEQVGRILRDHPPKKAVEHLIDAANANGGLDNVTVIVIRVDSVKSTRAA